MWSFGMNSKEALKTLKNIIGEEAYKQVLEQMAGTTVYFPALASSAEWVDKEERNARYHKLFITYSTHVAYHHILIYNYKTGNVLENKSEDFKIEG